MRWRLRVALRSRSRTRPRAGRAAPREARRASTSRPALRWHERRTLLKVAFPWQSTRTRRPTRSRSAPSPDTTRARTARDRARWEVAGQQWADLSARGHGVSLLNDSKYGYDCSGHDAAADARAFAPRTRTTRSRCRRRRGALTDQGQHLFAYSLLPHAGSGVKPPRCGARRELNVPVLVLPGRREMAMPPLLRIDAAGVQVSASSRSTTSARARHRRACIVAARTRPMVRRAGRGCCWDMACDEVREVDLDERRRALPVGARNVRRRVSSGHSQIKTLRLTPRRAASPANEDHHGQ